MKYLLDTCVISELVAKQPQPHVNAWIDSVDPDAVHLSVITIGEIRKGIEKLSESRRKAELRMWLDDELLIRFRGRIAPIDIPVMLAWGELAARLDAIGKPMSAMDSLITAIALAGDFVLVTRNEADFAHVGVRLLNPWQ